MNLRLAVAFAIVCLARTVPAVAQPAAPGTPPPTDTAHAPAAEGRERAEALLAAGLDDIAAERWQQGLDHFLEAQQAFHSPLLTFNIAYCQRALGRSVEARDLFLEFTREPLEGLAATRREEALGYIAELNARIAHLDLRSEGGSVSPELRLDGRILDGPAQGIELDPGYHSVQALLDGYRPFFVERHLGAGERWDVVVHLEPLPGRLHITADALPADVLLEGETRGQAPVDLELAPGSYDLEVRSPGRTPHRSQLRVAAGANLRVHAHLPIAPTPLRKRWWFWTAIGVGLVAVGATAYAIGRPDPSPPPYDGGNLGWVAGQTLSP